jgi:hypothetical protein
LYATGTKSSCSGNFHVASISPGCSPGIFDQIVGNPVLCAVAYSKDRMIDRRATFCGNDSRFIMSESRPASIDSHSDWTQSDLGYECVHVTTLHSRPGPYHCSGGVHSGCVACFIFWDIWVSNFCGDIIKCGIMISGLWPSSIATAI